MQRSRAQPGALTGRQTKGTPPTHSGRVQMTMQIIAYRPSYGPSWLGKKEWKATWRSFIRPAPLSSLARHCDIRRFLWPFVCVSPLCFDGLHLGLSSCCKAMIERVRWPTATGTFELALPGLAGVLRTAIGAAPWARCNDGSRKSKWRLDPWPCGVEPLSAVASGRCQSRSLDAPQSFARCYSR
ncbi:hypothetical protein B0H66DRAFT_285588 [Apodospora peruviana]|uniref:Uncharacterized protein n=1 Tax=Apodospora peruviana TaxID=516989 RepID=A0AAE0I0C4_9PEZI|nr:hypothetical protein B0H66DRAFT_285588 [Apodospora peruviana]